MFFVRQVLDTICYSKAIYSLYVGGIYMHRAKQYYLVKVDFDTYRAHAIPTKVDYYTSCISRGKIEVVKVMDSSEKSDIVKIGNVEINIQVCGYCKVKLRTGSVFDHGKFISLYFEILLLFIQDDFA